MLLGCSDMTAEVHLFLPCQPGASSLIEIVLSLTFSSSKQSRSFCCLYRLLTLTQRGCLTCTGLNFQPGQLPDLGCCCLPKLREALVFSSVLLVLLNWGDWLLPEPPPPAFTLGFFASICPLVQLTLVSAPAPPSSPHSLLPVPSPGW